MMALFSRLFAAPELLLAAADPGQAPGLAALHAAVFRRGWSEPEFEALLVDRSVLAHAAHSGSSLAGFIISRRAAVEAEILSLAVAPTHRRRGLAGRLLDRHLRALAAAGVQTVVLEVDEANTAARRLYARRAFRPAGRREGYYPDGAGAGATALILRCDLKEPSA